MRVFLTNSEIADPVGRELLDLSIRISKDGKIDLEEIKELRRWLRAHTDSKIVAVIYLTDIMNRITADKVIDQDELIELHLAVERVIPTTYRQPIAAARKSVQQEKIARIKQAKEKQRALEKQQREQQRQEEIRRAMRLRHSYTKVAGVSFQNDDFTERQDYIHALRAGDMLYFQHDPNNRFSIHATKVMTITDKQIGHVPEYLASRVLQEMQDGYGVIGYVTQITGGVHFNPPIFGVNIAIIYFAKDVPQDEFDHYVKLVLSKSA